MDKNKNEMILLFIIPFFPCESPQIIKRRTTVPGDRKLRTSFWSSFFVNFFSNLIEEIAMTKRKGCGLKRTMAKRVSDLITPR